MSGSPDRRGRQPLLGRTLSLLLLLVVVVGLVAQFVTLPFVILRPGPAVDVIGKPEQGAPVVTVEGARTYPTSGALYFTTVAQYGGPDRRPSAWDVLGATIDPRSEIRREEEVFPPQVTQQQVREQNSAAMTHSQEGAVAVALRELGRPVTETAVVAEVIPDGPAQGVLQKDDVITAVGGTKITRAPQLTDEIQKATGAVTLTLTRGGASMSKTITPVEQQGRRLVGVLVQPAFSFGVDVTIHAGDVGGPSAGMMFALGVYDTLTPGALTGGQRIAGTGTMNSTGAVGAIGGLPQKMDGAKASGATFFLAPKDNCADVPGNVPDGLTVTPVDTFEVALHAVQEIAAGKGDALPRCPGA